MYSSKFFWKCTSVFEIFACLHQSYCHVSNVYSTFKLSYLYIANSRLLSVFVAIPVSPEIQSLSTGNFLSLVAPDENNRHELDFLLHSFARYAINTTISYSCNRTSDEKKESRFLPISTSISTPISVPLSLPQCLVLECHSVFSNPTEINLSVHL